MWTKFSDWNLLSGDRVLRWSGFQNSIRNYIQIVLCLDLRDQFMSVWICQKSLQVSLWFFAVPYISLYTNKFENIMFIFVENCTLQNNFWHLNRCIHSYSFVINFHHALDIFVGQGNEGKSNVWHFCAWTLRCIPSSLLSLPIMSSFFMDYSLVTAKGIE